MFTHSYMSQKPLHVTLIEMMYRSLYQKKSNKQNDLLHKTVNSGSSPEVSDIMHMNNMHKNQVGML